MSVAIAETRWFDLGIYRVLAHPLRTNPFWQTFKIFRDGKYLGSQLSVPTVGDAEWMERRERSTKYADNSYDPGRGWKRGKKPK